MYISWVILRVRKSIKLQHTEEMSFDSFTFNKKDVLSTHYYASVICTVEIQIAYKTYVSCMFETVKFLFVLF